MSHSSNWAESRGQATVVVCSMPMTITQRKKTWKMTIRMELRMKTWCMWTVQTTGSTGKSPTFVSHRTRS